MAERFASELEAVHGEVIRCATMEEARQQLAELVGQAQWTTLGAMDRPICRELAAEAAGRARSPGPTPTGSPEQMAELSASVVSSRTSCWPTRARA